MRNSWELKCRLRCCCHLFWCSVKAVCLTSVLVYTKKPAGCLWREFSWAALEPIWRFCCLWWSQQEGKKEAQSVTLIRKTLRVHPEAVGTRLDELPGCSLATAVFIAQYCVEDELIKTHLRRVATTTRPLRNSALQPLWWPRFKDLVRKCQGEVSSANEAVGVEPLGRDATSLFRGRLSASHASFSSTRWQMGLDRNLRVALQKGRGTIFFLSGSDFSWCQSLQLCWTCA